MMFTEMERDGRRGSYRLAGVGKVGVDFKLSIKTRETKGASLSNTICKIFDDCPL